PSVIAAMRAAVDAAPEDAPLRLHLASLLLEAGEHAAALEQFAVLLAREPAHVEALRGAAQAAEATGDTTRAEGYRRLLTALGADSSASGAAPVGSSSPPLSPPAQRFPPVEGKTDQEMSEEAWNRLMGTPQGEDRVPVRSEPESDDGGWEAERPDITLA